MFRRETRLRRLWPTVTVLLIGQAPTQAMNFASGFALLHLLGIGAYAAYTIGLSLQLTVATVVDTGVTQSAVSLIGRAGAMPDVSAAYISAAKRLRRRISAGAVFIAPPLVLWLGRHLSLSPAQFAGISIGAIATVLAQSNASYAAPLLLANMQMSYYRSQILAASLRVLSIAALYATGMLSPTSALLTGAGMYAIAGWTMRGMCLRRGLVSRNVSGQRRQEAWLATRKFVAPLAPNAIFNAVHAQLVVALAGLFGTASVVAGVGAFGRLGQLFSPLGIAIGALIEPRVAKARPHRLKRLALWIVLGAFGILAFLPAMGYAFPTGFVWLLGAKYSYLGTLLPLALLVEAMARSSALLWTFCSARGYVSWRLTLTDLILSSAIEIGLIVTLDMSKLTNLLILGLATLAVDGTCYLLAIRNRLPADAEESMSGPRLQPASAAQ